MSFPPEFPLTPLSRLALEAGAGSGKTYTLVHLIAKVVLFSSVPLEKIVAVTFTRKAAMELQERLITLLAEVCEAGKLDGDDRALSQESFQRASQALSQPGLITVSTIDSFAHKVLFQLPFLSGFSFDTEMAEDQKTLLMQALSHVFYVMAQRQDSSEQLIYQRARQSYSSFGAFWQDFSSAVTALPDLDYADLLPGADEEELLEERREKAKIGCLSALSLLQKGLASFHGEEDLATFFAALKLGSAKKTLSRYAGQLMQCSISSSFDEIVTLFSADSGTKQANLSLFLVRALEKSPESLEFVQPLLTLVLEHLGPAGKNLLPQYNKVALLRLVLPKVQEYIASHVGVDLPLSYNEITRQAASLCTGHPEVKELYSYGFIDEFQDTSPLQYQFLSALFPGDHEHKLVVIGDPKQSIYRFRKVDLSFYLSFVSERSVSLFYLEENFRSSHALVDFFNRLFPFLFTQQVQYHSLTPQSSAPELTLRSCPLGPLSSFSLPEKGKRTAQEQEQLIADFCAEIVEQFLSRDYELKGRALRPSDIAILVRDNSLGFAVSRALKGRGIFVQDAFSSSSKILFYQEDLAFVYPLLDLLRSERLSLAHPAFSSPYLKPFTLVDAAEHQRILGAVIRAQRDFLAGDILSSLWRLCALEDPSGQTIFNRLRLDHDGDMRLENFQSFLEFLSREIARSPMSYSLSPETFFKKALKDFASVFRISREEAVTVMTAHGSKGLEFPVVIPLVSLKAPSERSASKGPVQYIKDGRWQVDYLCRESSIERAKAEEVEEDKRLFYVALTRASSHLSLLLPEEEDSLFYSGLEEKSFDGFVGAYHPALLDLSAARQARRPQPSALGSLRYLGSRDFSSRRRFLSSYTVLALQRDDMDKDHDYSAPDLIGQLPGDVLPRSARFGELVHSIFEQGDYGVLALDLPDIKQNHKDEYFLVERQSVRQFGSAWFEKYRDPLFRTLQMALQKKLPALEGRALAGLDREKQRREEEFFFPVSSSPQRLQLSSGQSYDVPPGLMHGYIDLLFESGGQFFVLDWKTTSSADYSPSALEELMENEQYLLQSRIYLTALLRKLRSTGRGYESLGGVFYVFLRGLGKGKDHGIFFARPSLEEMEHLEKSLSHGLSFC